MPKHNINSLSEKSIISELSFQAIISHLYKKKKKSAIIRHPYPFIKDKIEVIDHSSSRTGIEILQKEPTRE